MDAKGIFENFKKKMKELYPSILIGLEKIEEYYRIYFYLEDFDINDMDFNEKIGGVIKETFYKNGIFNLGLTHFNLERAKKVFPELQNEKPIELNTRIWLTSLKKMDFILEWRLFRRLN